jgi:hypothetical protein
VSTTPTPEHDETKVILDAIREIQENPELKVEAASNPESVLDRLGLSGIARSAVSLAVAGFVVAQDPSIVSGPVSVLSWW